MYHSSAFGHWILTCLEPGLDEVMLCLAGGLGEEAIVVNTTLLGLVPIHDHDQYIFVKSVFSPVEVSVVASPGAGVVVAAAHIIALGVAVVVVRAANSAPASSVA